jgi:hypothetical protein
VEVLAGALGVSGICLVLRPEPGLVPAGLADRGENVVGDPAPELFSFRLVASNNERVEALFVNGQEFLWSAKGRYQFCTLFIVVERADGLACIFDVEHLADIGGDKPGLVILGDGPDRLVLKLEYDRQDLSLSGIGLWFLGVH